MHKKTLQSIGSSESTTIEWKPSLSQIHEITESITAFANTDGGRLFVGVSTAGEVIGVQIGKGTVENLVNRLAQHTDPKIQPKITVKKIDGKFIIIIEVKQSKDKLVLADGRPYKRVGPSTRQMGKKEYEGLILEKHKEKFEFDTAVCVGATLKDIDIQKVQWFLQKAKEERGFTVPAEMSIRDILDRLELLHGEKLLNTAILLFGKNPQKFFVQAKIRAGRIKGTAGHDFIDMKVLEGTIPDLRENAMKFIMDHTKHAVFFDSNQRFDKWEYPLRAVEELLNNSLAHRDYLSSADINVTVYDDRIEVWNPGELPRQLTPEQLKGKHKSFPRNKFLAERLYLIKYIERWGRGTTRVVEEMRENKLSDPVFGHLSGGFEVTLHGPGRSFEKAIENQKLHKLDLNERQQKAIEYIKKEGQITRGGYCQINDIGETYAKKEINDLIQKDVIKRLGGSRNTYYILVTE